MDIAAGILSLAHPATAETRTKLPAWLSEEIAETIRQMEDSERQYNMAQDENLLDYCIYTQKALEAKYRYLLQLARQQQA